MDSLQNEVLLDGVRTKLANLHHDLDKKYLGIINRIDDQDSTRRNIAIDALIWITHALRPLRTLELQHALAMTVDAKAARHHGIFMWHGSARDLHGDLSARAQHGKEVHQRPWRV